MTFLSLAVLPLVITPKFGDVIHLGKGEVAVIYLDCGDPNEGKVVGPYHFGAAPTIPEGTLYVQALAKGDRGWNDINVRVVDGKPSLTRHNDKEYRIAEPVYDYEKKQFKEAYWWYWKSAPVGSWNNEVWPHAGLTLKGNGFTAFVTVLGSPSECLRIEGSDNDVTAYCVSGTQSRYMADRPNTHIKGDRNTLRGFIDSPGTGVFVIGNDNRFLDLTVYAMAVMDDSAAVHLYGFIYGGTTFTNCSFYLKKRLYEITHQVSGAMADDKHFGVTTWNVRAQGGFTHGFFSHGGDGHNIRRFTSVGNGAAVTFSPWFKTPDIAPVNNRTSQITER